MVDKLDAFLARVEGRALQMARFATGSLDEGMDIVQDAMFAFASRYGQKPEAEWRPLFYRVVQNRIRDWHRRNALRRGLTALLGLGRGETAAVGDPVQQLPDPGPTDPERLAASRQGIEALETALGALPLRQQQVFLLRAWEGLDVRDTAEAMGVSEGSVKTHYARAIKALRTRMEEHLS